MMALSGLRVGWGSATEWCTAPHELHLAAGGQLELMSGWMRPRYYAPNGGDALAASIVEAGRVRAHGGICDASTLGTLDIAGEDAAQFLDSLYLSPASSIGVGRSRYAALLREDGMVLDDGLVLRLGESHFVATTSSSHTAHVLAHLEFYRDTRFAGRRVALTDATEAWLGHRGGGPAVSPRVERGARQRLAGIGRESAAHGRGRGIVGRRPHPTFCARASPASSPSRCIARGRSRLRCGRGSRRPASSRSASRRSTCCASRRAI